MELTNSELIKALKAIDISPAWLASQCGFKRTAVSNWMSHPDKYPIPDDKRTIIIKRLHHIGKCLLTIR